MMMQRVPSHDAENEFQFILNQVCSGLGPVLITGVHGNAVLVSEAEWKRMQNFVARKQQPYRDESLLQSAADPV